MTRIKKSDNINRFLENIDLPKAQLLGKFEFTMNGSKLSYEESVQIVKFVKETISDYKIKK